VGEGAKGESSSRRYWDSGLVLGSKVSSGKTQSKLGGKPPVGGSRPGFGEEGGPSDNSTLLESSISFGVCVVEGRAKGEGGSRREEEDLVLGFVLGLMLMLILVLMLLGLVSGFLLPSRPDQTNQARMNPEQTEEAHTDTDQARCWG
jgi:hypothetical protein